MRRVAEGQAAEAQAEEARRRHWRLQMRLALVCCWKR
jgi:hypothetical protein